MTNKRNTISLAVQNPLSISLIIFTLVIVFIWMDYRNILKQQKRSATPMATISTTSAELGGFKLTPPDLSRTAAGQPKIMDSLSDDANSAPGLDGLISGLEEKVKSDPSNVSKRILLAQTYKELGMLDKSMSSLRQLIQEFPNNDRAKLVLSSVLSYRPESEKLNESLALLDELSKSKSAEVQQYLVQMYQGDALVRLKNSKSALEKWNLALKTMPNQDNRYQILEKRIADLTPPQ